MAEIILYIMMIIGGVFTAHQAVKVWRNEGRIINIPAAFTMNTLLGLGLLSANFIDLYKKISKKEN